MVPRSGRRLAAGAERPPYARKRELTAIMTMPMPDTPLARLAAEERAA
ncbi:hypothetical protein [Actinophytocola xanthii]|nr:hypothetical protein [Actinophytocola xanthii]